MIFQIDKTLGRFVVFSIIAPIIYLAGLRGDISIAKEVVAGNHSEQSLLIVKAEINHAKVDYGFIESRKYGRAKLMENPQLSYRLNVPITYGDDFQYQVAQNDRETKSSSTKENDSEKGGINKAEEEQSIFHNISEPIQFCQGKFKKLGGAGVEIITLKCPKADDNCSCEVDKKSLLKWIDCGGKRKAASKGSDLLSCESVIVGSGAGAVFELK